MKIIYENASSGVSVISCGDVPIEKAIADCVPAGVSYYVVDDDALPADNASFNQWRIVDGKIVVVGKASEQLFTALRAARDVRLRATDKYLLADYPINAADLEAVKTYRTALRALPDQPGAPWDGGGDATPWPELPSVE